MDTVPVSQQLFDARRVFLVARQATQILDEDPTHPAGLNRKQQRLQAFPLPNAPADLRVTEHSILIEVTAAALQRLLQLDDLVVARPRVL